MADYYKTIMEILLQDNELSTKEVVEKLKEDSDFKDLQTEIVDNSEIQVKGNFSRGIKQQIKLQTFVKSLSKCAICGGYLTTQSISVDHVKRKVDGGNNDITNGQVTHLYCNTTYKN